MDCLIAAVVCDISSDGTTLPVNFQPPGAKGERCSFALINLLINEGVNVNGRDRNNFTPLMVAALRGDFLMYLFLLLQGANESINCLVNGDEVFCNLCIYS